jgi:hypothetical protein
MNNPEASDYDRWPFHSLVEAPAYSPLPYTHLMQAAVCGSFNNISRCEASSLFSFIHKDKSFERF